MKKKKDSNTFEWRSREVSHSLKIYSVFEDRSSMSEIYAYRIEQLLTLMNELLHYLNALE